MCFSFKILSLIVMKTRSFFLLIVIAFVVMSCKGRQDPINELKELVEDVQSSSESFTKEDWREIEARYESINREMESYADEYTDEELRLIGRLKGRYIIYHARYEAVRNGKLLDNFMQQAKGMMEEFSGEAQGILDESSEDDEEVMEEL